MVNITNTIRLTLIFIITITIIMTSAITITITTTITPQTNVACGVSGVLTYLASNYLCPAAFPIAASA